MDSANSRVVAVVVVCWRGPSSGGREVIGESHGGCRRGLSA